MTDIALDNPNRQPAPSAHEADNYLTHAHGIKSWLFTLDHKRIGIMYLVSVVFFFFVGGMLAILLRTEHLTPTQTIMSAEVYDRVFSLHGIIMIFLFMIPAIPAALGNFILPIMLGAKDVAFPRLNLASFYVYVLGVLLAIWALLPHLDAQGRAVWGVDTGWTFYTPYSTTLSDSNVIAITAAAFVLGFSSIFTGMNFIVSIHKLRPPGMTWFKMPLFLWALYSTSVIQVLATPVLGITLLLLIVERAFKVGIFDPSMNGDPVLYQHFFWFYSHPAVYIMILPAMGVVSELIGTFSHKHIFGYRFIAFSSVAIAVIGFFVWGHHMFVAGQSVLAGTIFSFLTFLVAIPSAVKVFNWLATMHRGSIDLRTPMLFAISFMFIFGIGGLTGLFLGALSTNVHLTDTYFVVAHFHYVMAGTFFVFIGGLYYWWPKLFGRMYNEAWGRVSAILIFLGFNLTFFPQFIMGSHGMPRRYWAYLPKYEHFHVISTIGSYLMTVGMLVAALVLLHSLVRGRKAPQNPWGSGTMEWECASPPPHDNFPHPPKVHDPYDYTNMEYLPESQEFVRKTTTEPPINTDQHG